MRPAAGREMASPGARLVLVSTPIGNLGDLSPRAVEVLATADLVCCEDTRRTGRLLEHAGVRAARLLRVDDHTEAASAEEVCGVLAAGGVVAVVTDAGTPALCDPGQKLVSAAVAAGHEVTVVPGPSAGIAALAVSGLPAARHVFEGFLPRKGPSRAARLEQIAAQRRTVVLFESPHRLRSTLADLGRACGDSRRAVVARELTKLHEQTVRGTLAELREWAAGPVRGEVAVVVEGAPPDAHRPGDDELRDALERSLSRGVSRRDAAAAVASALGVSRRRVYNLGLTAWPEG